MEKRQIIEIIVKDAQEIGKLTESFTGYHTIPPLYLDLTMSKVKHLYAELLLLKEQGKELNMEQVEELLNGKQKHPEISKPPRQQEEKKTTEREKTFPKQEVPKNENPAKHEQLNKKREEHFLATQLKHDPIKDIKKSISLNEKIWFIKELFGGDIETYNNTLAKINQFDYLEQALDFLDKRFTWDYDNTTVKDFMEFVYRRFI